MWSNTDRVLPRRVGRRLLHSSIPLSFRWSMLPCSYLSVFTEFTKPFIISSYPNHRMVVPSAMFTSPPAWWFPLTPVRPGYRVRSTSLQPEAMHDGMPVRAAHLISAAGCLSLWEWWHWLSKCHSGRSATVPVCDCLCLYGQSGGSDCWHHSLHSLCFRLTEQRTPPPPPPPPHPLWFLETEPYRPLCNVACRGFDKHL